MSILKSFGVIQRVLGKKSIHMKYQYRVANGPIICDIEHMATGHSSQQHYPKLKNDAHRMAITTRGGKQTIDPPMPSNQENVRKDDDKVVKGSGEAEESTGKDAEVPMKVIPMPRPPLPFPQRLVKKTENGKYQRFITMLKQLSINVPLVEALEQLPGYAKFMKDLVTKKRSITFKDDDRLYHCNAITTRYLVQKKEDPGAHYSLYSRVIIFCKRIM